MTRPHDPASGSARRQLTLRLLDDYAAVAPAVVLRAVEVAYAGVDLLGFAGAEPLPLAERVARAEIDASVAGTHGQPHPDPLVRRRHRTRSGVTSEPRR